MIWPNVLVFRLRVGYNEDASLLLYIAAMRFWIAQL